MQGQSQFIPFGSFQVESGKLRVTDPCYCPGKLEGQGVLVLPALNGRWHFETLLQDDGAFGGTRVAKLRAYHESMHGYQPPGCEAARLFVDSGQMGVFDDAQFPRDEAQFEYMDESSFYKKACNLTYDDENDRNRYGGTMAFGGACSSGYGDGTYPCYVYQDGTGLAVSIEVEFIAEDEDEGDYDEDDDIDEDEESEDDDDDEEDEPDDE